MFINLSTLYKKLLPINKKLDLYQSEKIQDNTYSIKKLKRDSLNVRKAIPLLAKSSFKEKNNVSTFENFSNIYNYLTTLSGLLNNSTEFLHDLYYQKKPAASYAQKYMFQTQLIIKLLKQINKKKNSNFVNEIHEIEILLHDIRKNSTLSINSFKDMTNVGILLEPEKGFQVTNLSLQKLKIVIELTHQLNSKIINLLEKIITTQVKK